MKKFAATLMAAALIVPGMAAPVMAQPQQHKEQSSNHGKETHKTSSKQTYKNFRKGEKFDKRQARNYREIDYRRYKNMKAPPRGYHYVQSGNDILLVGLTSGIVSAVLTGMIR